jgi:glyoxylase-like metal-dependent hydrolase (beta-lactamase superfamily II)
MSQFEQISEHIWIMHAEHETDRPILAAIVGERRTLLMDAGASPAHAAQFRQELINRSLRLPDIAVLTHWHWDHSFGLSAWNIPAIGVRETADRLRRLKGLDWSDETLNDLVREQIINESSAAHIQLEYGAERGIEIQELDILFEKKLELDLGGVSCEIHHVGGDHAGDSCYLYIREDKTLFLGDALGPSVYGGPRRYTSGEFLRLTDAAFRFDAHIYVESHSAPVGKAEFHQDIDRYVELARLVGVYGKDRSKIAAGLKRFLQVEELPQEFANAMEWFLTD